VIHEGRGEGVGDTCQPAASRSDAASRRGDSSRVRAATAVERDGPAVPDVAGAAVLQ